jgi:hypothetical protein
MVNFCSATGIKKDVLEEYDFRGMWLKPILEKRVPETS